MCGEKEVMKKKMDNTQVGQLIGQLIASIGFPCVICLVMCWYIKYLTDCHKTETGALSDAIIDLKEVMIKIETKLDDLKGDDKHDLL